MWKDDEIWLPLLLAGKRFDAKFLFRGHDVILSHHVEEVSSLPLDAETAMLVSEVQTAISV
ncbi:MAG: hypothetical protein EOO65_03870 [Methanosarcinales archaeon]|nr:MAG: hypothetical protein EOO65_03870 [Methanosarcinales archaeon]